MLWIFALGIAKKMPARLEICCAIHTWGIYNRCRCVQGLRMRATRQSLPSISRTVGSSLHRVSGSSRENLRTCICNVTTLEAVIRFWKRLSTSALHTRHQFHTQRISCFGSLGLYPYLPILLHTRPCLPTLILLTRRRFMDGISF